MDALKILTIGNSFTDSLTRYFKQVVESAGCGSSRPASRWS